MCISYYHYNFKDTVIFEHEPMGEERPSDKKPMPLCDLDAKRKEIIVFFCKANFDIQKE